MGRLEGTVAIVTGATSGIGERIAASAGTLPTSRLPGAGRAARDAGVILPCGGRLRQDAGRA